MIYLVTYKSGAQQLFDLDDATAKTLAESIASEVRGALSRTGPASALLIHEVAGFAPRVNWLGDEPIPDQE